MGIFFTDKVEHRHGSKKVSRKTAKIEMKIKQEELKQLRQQTRQQEWERLQQSRQAQQQYHAEQQYIQQQYAQQQYEQYRQSISEEKVAEANQTILNKIQEQQERLTELLAYKQYLMVNKPKQTGLEIFLTWAVLLTIFFTLPTIIVPLIALVVYGSVTNSLDTEFSRHNKEVTRVNNEIKATQKTIQNLGKSVIRGF
jgi:Skp family chaperone for outer membrane proteins